MAKDTRKDVQDRKMRPKESLRILNTREKKEINQRIGEQWGCELDKALVWLMNNKGKIYVADKDIGMIDIGRLKVDKIGMYVCNVSDKGIRLSIEGSQMLGPIAKKNVLDLDDAQLPLWLAGKDIALDAKPAYVIVRYGNDFIGSGKCTGRQLLNFVPKTRRISAARS